MRLLSDERRNRFVYLLRRHHRALNLEQEHETVDGLRVWCLRGLQRIKNIGRLTAYKEVVEGNIDIAAKGCQIETQLMAYKNYSGAQKLDELWNLAYEIDSIIYEMVMYLRAGHWECKYSSIQNSTAETHGNSTSLSTSLSSTENKKMSHLINVKHLIEVLRLRFNSTERDNLLRELSIQKQDIILNATTAEHEASEIVNWFERRGQIDELEKAIRIARPKEFTSDLPPRGIKQESSDVLEADILKQQGSVNSSLDDTWRADVLVITALKEEYDEARKVDSGAIGDWDVNSNLEGVEVAFRTYGSSSGDKIRFAFTWCTRMRITATTELAGRLLATIRARCLAMSGVCAGRRGSVVPGDVIIGSLHYTYDAGSIVIERDQDGTEHSRFKADPDSVPLSEKWLHKAQSFAGTAGYIYRDSSWLAAKPPTLEVQGNWTLAQLRKHVDPLSHSEFTTKCPAWSANLKRLRNLKYISDKSPLELTGAGQIYIDDLLLLNAGSLPEPDVWKVRVAPIATGSNVMRDSQLFDRLSLSMREVLGIEMEAAAIARTGFARRIDWIVMKGVMDYADNDKDDYLKPFAARASAECLVWFIRENLKTSVD